MLTTLAEGRALLERTRPAHNPDGYPDEVRDQIANLASAQREGGNSRSQIARGLGISRTTLTRWLGEESPRSPGFVPVEASVPAVPSSSPTLSLVSPTGFRIEGLDLEGAILALARLS